MTRRVIDASAAIAFLLNEPGAEQVARHLPDSMMSAVNLTEVVGFLARKRLDPMRAHYLGCEIVSHDAELAHAAGMLLPGTMHLGLSLGDRACLALALREQAAVLTGDRVWLEIDIGVDVRLIR